jgi:Flp pilus assembly CpaF family ATPase
MTATATTNGSATGPRSVMAEKRERQRSALERTIGPDLYGWFDRDEVRELDLNDDGSVFAEVAGEGTVDTGLRYNPEGAESLVMAIAAEIAVLDSLAKLDDEEQCLDGKLGFKRGTFARVTLTAPPGVEQHTMELRKHSSLAMPLEAHLDPKGPLGLPMLERDQYEGVLQLIDEKANIAVCGEMFSGKTTFVNSCFHKKAEIDPDCRYVCIEHVREIVNPLKNKKMVLATNAWPIARWLPRLVRFNARSASVGECRDAESLNLLLNDIWLQMNGGFTTFHASTPQKALARMEAMLKTIKLEPQRDVLASSLNAVITLAHSHKAGRIVTGVYRVERHLDANGDYIFTPLGKVRTLPRVV